MVKRITPQAVTKSGRARRVLQYGKKVYKPGQFVPAGATKKAFKLRSLAAFKGWATRRFKIRSLRALKGWLTRKTTAEKRPLPSKEAAPLFERKAYRTMRVVLIEPKSPTLKTPVPLFEVGIYIYSQAQGAHTPASLKDELDRALELALTELNWEHGDFWRRMTVRHSREHFEDNVRVDADEATVGYDSAQRYMLWYTPDGGTFKGMTHDRTDYDESYFKRIERRERKK